MSAGIVSIAIMATVVAGSLLAGIMPVCRAKIDMQQWTIGNHGFGTVLVWVLMGGEVFTTFTFLGCSGWVYGKGAPVLYVMAYALLSQVVIYFVSPYFWYYSRRYDIVSQPEFFQKRFGSKALTVAVTMVGFVFIVPYLQLQLTGLGIIVYSSGMGLIHPSGAIIVSFVLVAVFFLLGGIRAIAVISVIKDTLVILIILFIGFFIPYYYFGGFAPMFAKLQQSNPNWLTLPGNTTNLGYSWYITTVLLTSCGLCMWPHYFASLFTARSAAVIRKNAVFMPLYNIVFPLLFFVGFTAVLVLPKLKNGDMALLTLAVKTFPAWLIGIIGAVGVLMAIVPAAVMTLAATVLLVKNIIVPFFCSGCTNATELKLSRLTGALVSLLVLVMTVLNDSMLVSLLLAAYAGITQLFPGAVAGLFWRATNRYAVLTGLLSGVLLVFILTLQKLDPVFGINAGFLALCANTVIVCVGSWLFPRKDGAYLW